MSNQQSTTMPSQQASLLGEYDVVVCGAGPAGIGAAIAAARGGARTLLVERLSYVGGLGTHTRIYCWCDTQGGPIFDELEERIGRLGKARRWFDAERHIYERGRVVLHGETLKAVALRMIREAGADLLFGTTVTGSPMTDDTVVGVFAANKGGLSLIKAQVVIDATADADLAASAGAEFLKGDSEDGRLQHGNFMFDLGNVDTERARRQMPPEDRLLELIADAHKSGKLRAPRGAFRPHAANFPYHLPEHTLVLNYWELEGIDGSDALAVSDLLTECQLIALEVVEFCREHLPGYESCEIARFWDVLSARESRRIVGQYTVTRDDVLAGRKFDDGIAQACFFIDFHDSPPGITVPYDLEFKRANTPPPGDWYEIPYRCLVPAKTRGLLVAGRCISSDRSAQASLRVMPTCMFTGEAAGTAAAMAIADGVLPHEVDGREVRKQIRQP